ncbi:MAG: GerMN domain-containing protein [Christensenellales bacterium]
MAQKWNLLTSQMNKIPQGYSSPITPSTVLNDYKIEDNKLILNVSEDILRSSGRLAIESLAWTFCNDEIKEVVLRVDENVVNLISDYQFNKISKEIGTNFTYETSYLFEADYTTVVFMKMILFFL